MIRRQILVLFFISIGVCGIAAAQSDSSQVDEVVVTATRVDEEIETTPAAVGVVNQDDIQLKQQLGLDESLVKLPGLFMQNRNNYAQDLRVSIRGFGARSNFGIRGIKILVDGIPETLPDGQGSVDGIDLGSARQIEVLRGPASSLYDNASGGVINVLSEEGSGEPNVSTRLSTGDFGYNDIQVKAGGETGQINYLVNASRREIDGFRDHSEFENTQINGNFRYHIGQDSNLLFTLNGTDQPTANDPGGIDAEQVAMDRNSARDRNVEFDTGEELDQQRVGVVYKNQIDEDQVLSLRNYYLWRDFANKLPFEDGGSVDLNRFYYGAGGQYILSDTLGGKTNRLTIGLDLDRQDDDRKRFNNNFGVLGDMVFDQNEDITSTGLYIQNELDLTERLEFTAGVRYDRVKFDISDRFLRDGDDSGQLTFSETSPMAGLLYQLSPAINLYSAIATSFETPTTTELANPTGQGGFNQALSPQTATSLEIGVKGTILDQHQYQVSVFDIDVDDELVPFELDEFPGRTFFENAGKSSRQGIELSFATEPIVGLQLSLAYTYSDFVFERFIDSNGENFRGNTIPGIPDQVVHGEVAYFHNSGLYGIFGAMYVDELFLNNANTDSDEAYWVANLRLGYEGYFSNWEIHPFIGVNNLLNEEYNGNTRINAFGGRYFEPAPDRNLYGGVTLRYNFEN